MSAARPEGPRADGALLGPGGPMMKRRRHRGPRAPRRRGLPGHEALTCMPRHGEKPSPPPSLLSLAPPSSLPRVHPPLEPSLDVASQLQSDPARDVCVCAAGAAETKPAATETCAADRALSPAGIDCHGQLVVSAGEPVVGPRLVSANLRFGPVDSGHSPKPCGHRVSPSEADSGGDWRR